MTLVSQVTSLAAAVRDKLNLMTPRLLPSGGNSGQVLGKTGADNYETGWVDAAQDLTAEQVRDRLASLSGENRLDSSAVKNLPPITIGTTAPSAPQIGDVWIDTN